MSYKVSEPAVDDDDDDDVSFTHYNHLPCLSLFLKPSQNTY